MKAEEFAIKCPKCGCRDKDVSTVKNPQNKEKMEKAGINDPEATVGSIKCSNCGYLFEYCKDKKCQVEFKKFKFE